MRQFLVIVLVFIAALVVILSLDSPAPQTPAPIVYGPDYNKPASTKPKAKKVVVQPESQQASFFATEEIPINTPMSVVASRYKWCDPCTGLRWDVPGIINLFEDNEIAAEQEFMGRSTLIGRVESIETNLGQGARVTFDGPFFASASVVCIFDQDQLSRLANLHKGSIINVDFFDPRRYLRKTIVMHCFYYGE